MVCWAEAGVGLGCNIECEELESVGVVGMGDEESKSSPEVRELINSAIFSPSTTS